MVFALRYLELSRVIIATALVIALVVVPTARALVRRLLVRTRLLSRPLVLVGGGSGAELFGRELARHAGLGYEVAAHVEREANEPVERLLERAAAASRGAVLTVFTDSLAPGELAAVIICAERRFSDVMLVPSAAPLRTHAVDVEQVGSALVMKYRYNLLRPLNTYAKRAVELGAVMLVGLVLLPLLGFLVLLIWLTSRGPVLFVQERIGRHHRVFRCLKFRTMYVGADRELARLLERDQAARVEYETYARLARDPRVTPAGRLLRRFSLDELPQLWNVLRGDMALVGPRPYLPREESQVGGSLETIVRVRPGMTGLWQVSGRSLLPFQERVLLDEYYIRNWSLWMDFSILLRTVWVVVAGRGAV
ncbi:exopolysaccharide biosynthesis polyprenyl glycosylphosphotransferase [candidate division WOR-3 bacterium]|nr:exopolysaccharide biosynthesis polyprenyl glycosylphosphotransferase [candidate division WOR-3 bacterium]